MKSVTEQRLYDAWQQCLRHKRHMDYALSSIGAGLPVTAQTLKNMSDEQIQDWDQFVLRFTKLQDAMGTALYPCLLSYLQEPYEDRSMLDKLHRLEKLGFLTSVDAWHELRAARNQLTHDYPLQDEVRASYLNDAVNAARLLGELLARVEKVIPTLGAS